MNPEEKSLLERVAVLSEENNQILRGIRRSSRWGTVLKVIYWMIIIGISLGAYFYIQPYVDKLMQTYSSVIGTVNKPADAGNQISVFQKVMNSLPK